MASKQEALSEEQLLYSQLSEYLDDELSEAQRKKFEDTMRRFNLDALSTDYGIRRGQLQILAQNLSLDEAQLHKIHQLVEDDATRANHEAKDIDEFSRFEVRSQAFRYTIFLVIVAGLVALGLHFFGPTEKVPFKALDSLIYEAIVMSEDPDERLDFPTDGIDELNNYFARYPDLGFKPKVLKNASGDWDLVGGTVIDYDVAKVLAVQWNNKQQAAEKLFLFFYEGELESLPASTPGNYQGLLYQAYASDRLNVIAWQAAPKLTGMLIGYRGAKDLAEIAYKSVGL